MTEELFNLSIKLASVVLYRNVLKSDVISSLREFISCSDDTSKIKLTEKYSDFVFAVYNNGGDLGKYLEDAIRCDDNIYVRTVANSIKVSPEMQNAFEREMQIFSEVSALTADKFLGVIGMSDMLPAFASTAFDFTKLIPEFLEHASTVGYGVYARYTMFQVVNDSDRILVPVPSPDRIAIDDLIGYELERGKVVENTIALLENKPAANTLLCGDAGTGKSSTVKACVNMLRDRGLRLIEIKKDQLLLLPKVMGEIADNPLKFIIFVDDLSFTSDDDSFGALKAVLEGSAAAKADNAVIYATSNRRHIVKETFASREGDDVHRNDTMQEMMSLSARFGLTVLFQKPDKKLYLTIVHALSEKKGINMPENELDIKAEAFALSKGGRSARVAEQFTDSLLTLGA